MTFSAARVQNAPAGRDGGFCPICLSETGCVSDILLYIRITMKNLIGREHSINPQIMLKIYKKTIIEFGFRMIS